MAKKIALSLGLALVVFSLNLQAEYTLMKIHLRFFKAVKTGSSELPPIVTSSFLHPTVTASIESKFELNEVQNQIKRVFNLQEVSLITEAGLIWNSKDSDKLFYNMRLDSKEYLISITPYKGDEFRLEFFEQGEGQKTSLLDTKINLPFKNVAVLGFEDKQGKPYFFSFHVSDRLITDVMSSEIEDVFAKGAVEAKGEIKPPKLLKKIQPAYPEEARKKGIEGVVILEAKADEKGNVVDARILKSVPELDQAAVDALKQWKYQPMIIKGKPMPILFTVTVKFALDKDKKKGVVSGVEGGVVGGVKGGVQGGVAGGVVSEKELEEFAEGAVKVEGDINPPRLLKKANPVYPEEARKKGIEGVVILCCRTDEQGNVVGAKILKSIPELDQAAIDALKQWKYEPMIIEGKPSPLIFTVTIRFQLK
jgi:TonB family protein